VGGVNGWAFGRKEVGMRFRIALGVMAVVLAVSAMPAGSADEKMKAPPFGGEADVAFAQALWSAMDGYRDWRLASGVYPGKSPHGMFLRMYYNVVTVDGKPYHVIVKDNFGGEGATLEKVSESPNDYLGAVTVMLQREAGYDPDNNDWFWVKYAADGAVDENDAGTALAGRVAKGMSAGCIACHANAGGDDYVFVNDR
jgi:hypothetical protein